MMRATLKFNNYSERREKNYCNPREIQILPGKYIVNENN